MLPSVQRHCGLRTAGKPNWICTFFWTFIVVLAGLSSVSSSTTCEDRDLFSLQIPCRKENDELVTHVGTKQTQKLCSSLHQLWFCVARNVPHCFHNMTQIYRHLTHSPHNCRLSTEEFLQIQKIIRENEAKEGTETSPSTTEPSTPELSTKGENSDGEDDGYVVNGNNSGQTGNSGSSSWSCDHVTYLLLILLTGVHVFPAHLPVL